jgi:hypothetical protein
MFQLASSVRLPSDAMIVWWESIKQIIKVIIFLGAFTATRYVPFPSQIILQIGVGTCRAGKSRFSRKEVGEFAEIKYCSPGEEWGRGLEHMAVDRQGLGALERDARVLEGVGVR